MGVDINKLIKFVSRYNVMDMTFNNQNGSAESMAGTFYYATGNGTANMTVTFDCLESMVNDVDSHMQRLEEERLIESNPALKDAHDRYKMLLALVKNAQ